MNTPTQNSAKMSETLKARKAHLTALLEVIDTKPGKTTAIQTLTINAIRAEMGFIEHQLKNRS